jgi:hypothetical protein
LIDELRDVGSSEHCLTINDGSIHR